MAARLKIILLDRRYAGTQSFNVAFWCDVPAARQAFYADANKTSAWKDATAEDIAALRSGAVVEIVEPFLSERGVTLAQAQTTLQATWTAHQDRVTAHNPWQRYGTTFDGTSWQAAGVS